MTLKEFIAYSKQYNVIPITRTIVADRVTPVSVYEKLVSDDAHSFLLESVDGSEHVGRYSFVGRKPFALFTCQEGISELVLAEKKSTWKTTNPLQDLKKLFTDFRSPDIPTLPRFWGGAVGFFDYDTVRYFEKLPCALPDQLKLPLAAFQFPSELVVFDRFSQIATLLCVVYLPKTLPESKLMGLYNQAIRDLDQLSKRLQSTFSLKRSSKKKSTSFKIKPLVSQAQYMKTVDAGKEHIRAGNIIQVVLSQRWEISKPPAPFQVYRALRLLNPSPYMYYLRFPTFEIVGSSPELLVRKEGSVIETMPIAGTRPRGKTSEEDLILAEDLKADPKERAEHLMLVDLGRNDLGRVSKPGTVQISNFMSVEYYSHVMHLVSTVKGAIDPKSNTFDLFQACFPAGTVSGAPKIRAMQIIDELETFRRGPYAGALGFFSFTGNMDMAITIRTVVFSKGKAYLQAGAGIVADSIPEKEFKECEQKAAALLAAFKKAGELE